jgi:protease-4
VDKIGGLDDAIAKAASLAKIKNYSTQNYPEYEKNFNDLLANFHLQNLKLIS